MLHCPLLPSLMLALLLSGQGCQPEHGYSKLCHRTEKILVVLSGHNFLFISFINLRINEKKWCNTWRGEQDHSKARLQVTVHPIRCLILGKETTK